MSATGQQRNWAVPVGAALIFVICFAAYSPAVRCGFIWDDDGWIIQNPLLRDLNGLRSIWLRIGSFFQYYPMVFTSWWFDYHLWGLNPIPYHIENILLHALGACMLWLVLRRLQVPGAWVAAAAFALHPVNVESVAWITERKNVLSGAFYFSSALVYLRYALVLRDKSDSDKSERFYTASLVLFLCAMLSKTATCTLPAALLIVLWWKRNGLNRKDVRDLIRFFAFGIALGLLTAWMEKDYAGAGGEEWSLSLVERFLVAGRALCFYAGKLLWPGKLTFIYPRWHINAAVWWQYLFPLAVAGIIATFWLIRRQIGKGPLVAALFFVATLFPALGFFNVYFMRYSFVQDHFQYLASAGLITLIVAAGCRAAERFGKLGKGIATVLAVLILPTLGILTWRQCHIYKNHETLWRDTLQKNPSAWIAHNNLGNLLLDRGDLDEAIGHYRQVLKLKPDHAKAYTNLGNALLKQNKFDEAIRHYNQSLRLNPNLAPTYYNLSNALLKQGSSDEAVEAAEKACELTGHKVPEMLRTLADAYAAAGRFAQAIATAEEALNLALSANQQQLAEEIKTSLQSYKYRQAEQQPPGDVPEQ